MNKIFHYSIKYIFSLFLLLSAFKHLYNIYFADASIMATGYPEEEATKFVIAVLETGFLIPFICCVKIIASFLILIPKREQLGVIIALPYSTGMLLWGIFMVPSHLLIMSLIFLFNFLLVVANWEKYKTIL
tara:strand:+ start:850 stop:1242 length:393 start_codon:yes stop_codon:yes gene_type:complete